MLQVLGTAVRANMFSTSIRRARGSEGLEGKQIKKYIPSILYTIFPSNSNL
jgi:hypothetical protein